MIVQIAFLTGRSSPGNCSLSPIQSDFLSKLSGEERVLLPLNFPYKEGEVLFKETPLIIASIRNAIDYFKSRFALFRKRYRPVIEELVNRAPHTVFLAGSCGVEILANLQLPPETLMRMTVIAYGPVARTLPKCDCVIIQGKKDWLSSGYFPNPNFMVEGSHMNYLENEEVLSICNTVINRVRCGIVR